MSRKTQIKEIANDIRNYIIETGKGFVIISDSENSHHGTKIAEYLNAANYRKVVMCKDCIHRIKDDVGRSYCALTDLYCGDTCYCNYGELRGKHDDRK